MKPSLRHGLPYGWWKNPHVWGSAASIIALVALMTYTVTAWLFGGA